MKQLIEQGEFDKRVKGAREFNESMRKGSGQGIKGSAKDFGKSYEIKDKTTIEKLLEKNFHVWVEYPVHGYLPTLQKNYEIFCGGWLHFWDLNISAEETERQLYFRWDPDSVVIYISNPTRSTKHVITVVVECPGDPPKAPPPPPPGDA